MQRIAVAAAIFALGLFTASAHAEDHGSLFTRVTLEAPVFTRHVPDDAAFEDHNWGLFAEVQLSPRWSMVGGDFRNSYHRNTAFAGVAWRPLQFDVSKVHVAAGGVAAIDLNGGYRPYNSINPLLGAVSVTLRGSRFGPSLRILNRAGLAFTIIPPAPKNGSTAVNVALTFRLAD